MITTIFDRRQGAKLLPHIVVAKFVVIFKINNPLKYLRRDPKSERSSNFARRRRNKRFSRNARFKGKERRRGIFAPKVENCQNVCFSRFFFFILARWEHTLSTYALTLRTTRSSHLTSHKHTHTHMHTHSCFGVANA